MEYIPVAVRTQILFFCVSDLASVDPMYQYSLEWFLNIFLSGIANSERAGNPDTDSHVFPDNQAPPWHRHTWVHFHSRHTHVDTHPGSLVHTLIRLTLHMNTPPTPSLPGANAPRGCAPDCSFGCWEDWLGWVAPQGSFFSAPLARPHTAITPLPCRQPEEAHCQHQPLPDLQPLQQCLPQPLREAQADVRLPAVCPHHDEPGQDQPGAWPRGSQARSRTDGLRGCPVAELREQGGKTGHIRQEGTARADGQSPPGTATCVKQPGGPELTVTQQVLCTGLPRTLRVLVSRDHPEPPSSPSHECQGFRDALGSIESDILHCLSPHCVPSAGLTATL